MPKIERHSSPDPVVPILPEGSLPYVPYKSWEKFVFPLGYLLEEWLPQKHPGLYRKLMGQEMVGRNVLSDRDRLIVLRSTLISGWLVSHPEAVTRLLGNTKEADLFRKANETIFTNGIPRWDYLYVNEADGHRFVSQYSKRAGTVALWNGMIGPDGSLGSKTICTARSEDSSVIITAGFTLISPETLPENETACGEKLSDWLEIDSSEMESLRIGRKEGKISDITYRSRTTGRDLTWVCLGNFRDQDLYGSIIVGLGSPEVHADTPLSAQKP